VRHNRNIVFGQEHELDVSTLLKLRHSAETLSYVCTQWLVENGMALCAGSLPYTHVHKGQLWLAAQTHGHTLTLAHHSENFLNAPRICILKQKAIKMLRIHLNGEVSCKCYELISNFRSVTSCLFMFICTSV
jgi:hypothetical protein